MASYGSAANHLLGADDKAIHDTVLAAAAAAFSVACRANVIQSLTLSVQPDT